MCLRYVFSSVRLVSYLSSSVWLCLMSAMPLRRKNLYRSLRSSIRAGLESFVCSFGQRFADLTLWIAYEDFLNIVWQQKLAAQREVSADIDTSTFLACDPSILSELCCFFRLVLSPRVRPSSLVYALSFAWFIGSVRSPPPPKADLACVQSMRLLRWAATRTRPAVSCRRS